MGKRTLVGSQVNYGIPSNGLLNWGAIMLNHVWKAAATSPRKDPVSTEIGNKCKSPLPADITAENIHFNIISLAAVLKSAIQACKKNT